MVSFDKQRMRGENVKVGLLGFHDVPVVITRELLSLEVLVLQEAFLQWYSRLIVQGLKTCRGSLSLRNVLQILLVEITAHNLT